MRRDVCYSLGLLKRRIAELEKKGKLEPGQAEVAKKAIGQMEHAAKVGNRKELEKAITNFSLAFLKIDLFKETEAKS